MTSLKSLYDGNHFMSKKNGVLVENIFLPVLSLFCDFQTRPWIVLGGGRRCFFSEVDADR
jgi:hypothetical protein